MANQLNSQVHHASLTDSIREWATSDSCPNLGNGGIAVTVLIGSYFAAQIVCNLTVLLLFGRHAFFDEGLRVQDWKHSVLSNGVHLPWYGTLMIGPSLLPICAVTVFGAEYVAKHLRRYLSQRPFWCGGAVCFLGGIALVALFVWFYSPPRDFPLIHPIPLSALIGGVVLLWKGIVTLFRGISTPD